METERDARDLDTLYAIQTGMTTVLAALIQTHPHYDRFQLHLTSLVEKADAGSWQQHLSADQRHQARHFVEWMQQLRSLPPRTPT